MLSPISRSVKAQAAEQVDVIARRRHLDGDANTRARLRDRLASLADLPTHDDTIDSVDAAAEAVARAVLLVERVQSEFDDAQVSDRALTVARERLIEAGLFLETLAHVKPHDATIAALRESARQKKADAGDT